MVYSLKRFFVICDKCGKDIETNAADEIIANETAQRKGWKCITTYPFGDKYHPPVYKNYCPKCKEQL